MSELDDSKNTVKHSKLETNTIQTICSCGEKFIYTSDFDKHLLTPPNFRGDVMELDEILDRFQTQIDDFITMGVDNPDTIKEIAKRQILANYTPNSEVEQQVLIGRKAEQELAYFLWDEEYNEFGAKSDKRSAELDRQITTLKAQLKGLSDE